MNSNCKHLPQYCNGNDGWTCLLVCLKSLSFNTVSAVFLLYSAIMWSSSLSQRLQVVGTDSETRQVKTTVNCKFFMSLWPS